MITQQLICELFNYKDGSLYWKFSSKGHKTGSKAGSIWKNGYVIVKLNYKTYRAHRLIFMMHHGYMPIQIDHKDKNRSNNKIENLRDATSSQQICNVGLRKDNNSGVKGVVWDKPRNKWRVHVWSNKVLVHQSRHKDLELAELVAIEARNKYHKEFACHV